MNPSGFMSPSNMCLPCNRSFSDPIILSLRYAPNFRSHFICISLHQSAPFSRSTDPFPLKHNATRALVLVYPRGLRVYCKVDKGKASRGRSALSLSLHIHFTVIHRRVVQSCKYGSTAHNNVHALGDGYAHNTQVITARGGGMNL